MKIVQIVTQMEAGGAQRVASLLTEGLRERGHDAQIWFLYKKRPAYAESDYVRVLSPQRPRIAGFAALGLRLWKDLREFDPDAVVTHTHSANGFAAPIAAAAGVRVRVAVHHNPFETYSAFMKAADRCAFFTGCYSTMVTVSGGVRESFSRRSPAYRRRIHRIYNGVATATEVSPMNVRKTYQVPTGLRLLVNVGRLAQQKNQVLLLQLLQRVPEAFLLVVGEGELRQKLLAEALSLGVASRVRFTGELAADQVSAVLKAADAFVLPSTYEAFCLAAVEALQSGVPVIATDLPCLREVLGDRQVFFPRNDLDALVRSVKYLLRHQRQWQEMHLAGQVQAERFSIARMVGEYECLLADASPHAKISRSAPHDFGRLQALGGIPRVHDQL